MIAKTFSLLLVLGSALSLDLTDVDPNTLSCDPNGQEHLLLPHFEDCSKFYMCNHGNEVEFSCAPGTIFDFSIQACNHEWATTCLLREVEETEEAEIEDSSEENEETEADESSEEIVDAEVEDSSEENVETEADESSEEIVETEEEGSTEENEEAEVDGSGEENEEAEVEGSGEEFEEVEGSGEASGDFEWSINEEPEITPGAAIIAMETGKPRPHRPRPAVLESLFAAKLDCNNAREAALMIPFRGDCQRFWRCVNGLLSSSFCSDGLFFNEKTMQCDFEANVRCNVSHEEELNGEFMIFE